MSPHTEEYTEIGLVYAPFATVRFFPNFQIIREWLVGSSAQDYSSSDRQATLAYLEHAVRWLSAVFGVEAPEPPPEPGVSASVQPSLLDPLLAHKRAALFKYGGNPDLQPIRTTEFAPLVRVFHQTSASINQVVSSFI